MNGSGTASDRDAMPPAGKQNAGKRKAAGPARSDGAGNAREEASAQRTRGLDPAAVKEFLAMLRRPDRLGPDYFTDAEMLQWSEWLDAVPASAAVAPGASSLIPVGMPQKCLPRPAGGSSGGPSTSITQQEIITYTNAGGRRFGAAERRRQYSRSQGLHLSDVPVGSTVAVHCDPEALTQPGYRTPFWIGDVINTTGESDSGKLEKLTLHFRMPQAAGGLFCDDVTKPWNLACQAQHTYSLACERGVKCKAAARKAGSHTSKMTYVCEAAEILETKLELNDKGKTLKAESKTRLAQSAPKKGAWDALLGLRPKN